MNNWIWTLNFQPITEHDVNEELASIGTKKSLGWHSVIPPTVFKDYRLGVITTTLKLLILSNGIIFKSAFQALTSVPNYVSGSEYFIKTFLVVFSTTATLQNIFSYNEEYVRVALFQGCYL